MKLSLLLMFCAAGLMTAPIAFAKQSISPSQAISTSRAAAAFAEAHAVCTAEQGKLWGLTLCVPMMFVDPHSREAVLNRPAKGAKKDESIYRLTLPKNVGIANTTFDFQGKSWSMVKWPLPENTVERDILLMHESYHSIQPALGLQGDGGLGKNGELDSRNGRIWLRAEFSALRTALQKPGQQRKHALADALLFRVYRMSLWPHAAADERSLELNEGLAESTGIDSSQRSAGARVAAAVHDIVGVERERSYVRSFAYATGPAYAELLDAVQPAWRSRVKPDFAFGTATAAAYHLPTPEPNEALALAAIGKYDGKRIIFQENARAKVTAARNVRFKKALVDGPTLTLPLKKFSISFDPRTVYSLPGKGSVYQTLTLGDTWGRLNVHDDGLALIPSTFSSVTVPLANRPAGMNMVGKDWTLKLNKDYRFQPDPHHAGSFIVTVVQ